MISRVKPSIRRILVATRIAAMTRGLKDGQRELHKARSIAASGVDKVAVSLTECDLLSSNLQPAEAQQVFEVEIEPLLKELDHQTATLIADNKTELLMASSGQIGDFYHLVDVRRILGVEIRDHASKLQALSQAAAGKHYDALPTYWQQLRSSYELQNWRARNIAEADFCDECISLGWLKEAAYHAMLSCSKKPADRVGDVLLACRDPKPIRNALTNLLAVSALREHALQVARILVKCSDAMPDELLAPISEFLSQHASFTPTGWHDTSLFENIWDLIKQLAHRFGEATVRNLIDVGLSHPVFSRGGPARTHLIDALNVLTKCAPTDVLPRIAEAAIGLVTNQRSDMDYTPSLNLLCHAAERGGEGIKASVRDKLYPPNTEIKDSLLIQVGPFLGWHPKTPDSFTQGALQTANALRKQVQKLGPGEEPATIGGYGTYSNGGPDGRTVVHMQGAMHHVDALAAHRAMISDDGVRALLEAMLAMIAEPENVISNRVALVMAFEKFIDRFPDDLRLECVELLEPLAAGDISEPSQGQSHAEATNLLNPFKIGGGDPVDLQGAALKIICMLDRDRPGICPTLHHTLLLSAVTSAIPEIRRYGLFAAQNGANLTSIEKSAVALAGLDPDPRVARLAIQAMLKSSWLSTLDMLTWQIVIRVVESAANSSDGGYRASASRLVGLLPASPAELSTRLNGVRNVLENDVLFSVRSPL